MTEIRETLDGWVGDLAEMGDGDLEMFLHLLERAYIHTLIEQGLRGAPTR
jgi:hypothetical protein